MPIAHFRMTVDATPLQKVVREISRLVEVSQELFDRAKLFLNNVQRSDLARVDSQPAMRAGDLVLVVQPGNKLLELASALRTHQREILLANAG